MLKKKDMNLSALILMILLIPLGTQAGVLQLNFLALTNMPGVSVEGKLKSPLKFQLKNNKLQELNIMLLDTGMTIRDEHMQKDIFNKKPIKFKVEGAKNCLNKPSCSVKIMIQIRQIQKKYFVQAKRRAQDLSGSFDILLSDFKIPLPSKFGITVKDLIKINFNVTL